MIAALGLALVLVMPVAPNAKARTSDGPADLVDKAYGAAAQKRYCDAIPLFLALHERAPQAKHLYRAAEVALAAGDRRLALDLYRSLLAAYPKFEKRAVVAQRVRQVEQQVAGAGQGAVCPEPATVCGDWIVRPGEQCDDGNRTDGDGCDGNCSLSTCGNGVRTAPEQCDDGNLADGDGCDGNCTPSACGNSIVAGAEECDDGNEVDGDSCDRGCVTTRCGNGVVTVGEECDDANDRSGDGCDRNCARSSCGNGALQAGEQCDDGNLIDGDGCDTGCTATACGNGVVSAGETCDDGNRDDGDACDGNCTATSCGNGVVTAGEQCDDGNLIDGDGCSSACTRPAARMLAGASAFAGAMLMVAGAAACVGGSLPLFDHAAASAQIEAAEQRASADPTAALEQARLLQARAAAADQDWRDFGLPLVVAGGASLLGGGGLLALGFALFDNGPAAAPANPDDEERVP